MRSFFLLLFISFSISSFSQTIPPDPFVTDSLAIMKIKSVRPQFKFDNRVTWCERQALQINGFDIGVLLSEKLRITLGYYSMDDRLKRYDAIKDGQDYGKLVAMKYGSLNTEIIYKDTRFLSFGMPLELGMGWNKLADKNFTTGEMLSEKSGALVFVNFGMSATFKPMRFLGLKTIVGYRKTAYNQVKDFDFDGFFTSVGFNIDIHAITTDVRMYRLMKKYHRGNKISNAVEIITG